MIVDLPPIQIMYVASDKGITGSQEAFNKLESKLPSFKKRKFYGLVFGVPPDEKYWACVALEDDDKPEAIGFKTGVIPGGKYALKRVYDWESNMKSIGETFKKLISEHQIDTTRPCVEFYHGMNYMVARVPIK